jgi:hypothetical protein
MNRVLVDGVNLIILLAFLLLMLGSIEAGFRSGRKARFKVDENTRSNVLMIAAAILGVLGLLLGFTISMAVTRFEMRKQLVLKEANALGTSYLRTKLLPAPDSGEIANLLSQYVDARLPYSDARDFSARIKVARERAVLLQNDFWDRAVAYAKRDPNPVRAGLLLQSLNEVIDLESARWTAFNNRVPAPVIYMDACISVLAVSVIGYSLGLGNQRQLFSTCILTLVLTLVLGVIVELDSPQRGIIRVSQQPMIDLQHQLATRESSVR